MQGTRQPPAAAAPMPPAGQQQQERGDLAGKGPNDEDEARHADAHHLLAQHHAQEFAAQNASQQRVGSLHAVDQQDLESDHHIGEGIKLDVAMDQLDKVFGWTPEMLSKVPSAAARETNRCLRVEDPAGWKAMETLLQQSFLALARAICPAESADLAHDVCSRILGPQSHSENSIRTENRNVANALATIIEMSPRRAVQRRVAHAVLVKGFQMKTITQLRNEIGLTLGSSTREKAYIDFRRMASGEILQRSVIRRTTFDAEGLEDAVRFMLSEENLLTLSWGKHTVRLSPRESVELPVLIRRKPECDIYADYVRHQNELASGGAITEAKGKHAISRSSFYKLLSLVTASSTDDAEASVSDDEWTGVLIDDSCIVTSRIIEDFVDDPKVQAGLSRQLSIAQNFLKQRFRAHVRDHDEVAETEQVGTHDIQYALARPGASSEAAEATHRGRCNACNFIHLFLHDLRCKVDSVVPQRSLAAKADALLALDAVRDRFVLFCGHQVRIANHERAVDAIDEAIRKQVVAGKLDSARAIITSCWYKGALHPDVEDVAILPDAGVLWHSFRCDYYQWIDGAPVKQTVYADQVVMDPVEGNVNSATVGACLEAFLAQLHTEAPHIKSVVLQQRGELSHESTNLVVLCTLLNSSAAIKIERLLRLEASDDNALLEGHFARSRNHLKRFAKRSVRDKVRCILTPRGVAAALAWNGGVQDSIVQLVRIDRGRLKATCKAFRTLANKFSASAGRAGEIEFVPLRADWEAVRSPEEVQDCSLPFQVKIWSHPRIGPGVGFVACIEAGTFDAVDSHVLSELSDCGLRPLVAASDDDDDDKDAEQAHAGAAVKAAAAAAGTSKTSAAENEALKDGSSLASLLYGGIANAGTSPSPSPSPSPPAPPPAAAGQALGPRGTGLRAAEGDRDYFIGHIIAPPGDEGGQEADSDVDDEVDALHAPPTISGYGSPRFALGESVVGVEVARCSSDGVKSWATHSLATRQTTSAEHEADAIIEQRRDLVATAVRLTASLLKSGHFEVREGNESLPDFFKASGLAMSGLVVRPPGWARRDRLGRFPFGASFADFCRADLLAILRNVTVATQGVRSALMRAKPELYRLPGPAEIQREIKRSDGHFGKTRLRPADLEDPSGERPRKRGRPCQIPRKVDDFMQTKIHANPEVRPRDLLNAIKAQFGDLEASAESMLDDKKLKQRIAGLKKARKKKRNIGL